MVGAGIAGLVAGPLLKQARHRMRIIEANADRIGERIKTFRTGPELVDKPSPFVDLVHFAGEHTSLKHSWIEGALESAVRAALEVNTLT